MMAPLKDWNGQISQVNHSFSVFSGIPNGCLNFQLEDTSLSKNILNKFIGEIKNTKADK